MVWWTCGDGGRPNVDIIGPLVATLTTTAREVDARSVATASGDTNELASLAGGVVDDSGADGVRCFVVPSRSLRSHVCSGAVHGGTICSTNRRAMRHLRRRGKNPYVPVMLAWPDRHAPLADPNAVSPFPVRPCGCGN